MVAWGLVVIATNYTHAGGVPVGSPGTAAEPGAGTANVARARQLVEILRGLGYVDTNRLALHGHSMGAFVTSGVLSAHPDVFRVASHTAGGSRPDTGSGAAPTDSQVAAIRTPYQLHHGDNDMVVPLASDQRLASVLASRSVTYELHVYAGADHDDVSQNTMVLDRVRAWFAATGIFWSDPCRRRATARPAVADSTSGSRISPTRVRGSAGSSCEIAGRPPARRSPPECARSSSRAFRRNVCGTAFAFTKPQELPVMKPPLRIAVVAVIAVAFGACLAATQTRKPNVVILATGGTIAGAAATGTQAGYTSGAVTIDAMLKAVPGITDLATIKGEQISNVGSQDMSFAIMMTVANRINELGKSSGVDGIVITHGTDTMEETAYFLNLTVKTDKPVVMVGSMRPSTAVSADGPLNLYNAVGVAADPNAKGRGVLVVMNDWIHGAHSLTKTSTTAVQTFMSPVRGLVGTASYGKNDFYTTPRWTHTTKSEFAVTAATKQLPRVDIIFVAADSSADLIDAAVAAGAKGIVIAGVGNGNMPKASVTAAANAVKKGVVVVRSSRVVTGNVGRNVELNDDELGFIASDELNPQKARILLTLALMKTRTAKDLQALFQTY